MMKIKRHKIYVGVLSVYSIGLALVYLWQKLNGSLYRDNYPAFTNRKILQLSNCSPRSVEQFPEDFMTLQQRQQGGVIFHIIVSVYMFMALAIICDDFFVSALERICAVLKLKHDVAGATFMAAGSSAPELFTSIIGVFITNSDVGVSTIVGSAVFNILCIVALCGIFGGSVICLSWWPLFRDSLVYLVTVLILIVEISDSKVYWYEALIMLVVYVLYIVLLWNNDKMHLFVITYMPCMARVTQNTEYTPLMTNKDSSSLGLLGSSDDEEVMETGDVDSSHSKIYLDDENNSVEGEFNSPFDIPDSFCQRLYWVSMLPIYILCYLTIPDCRKPGCWRKLFFLTFVMSIVWIAVISYILVWMVCITGDALGIPDTVMGLTLLAAGTSIPDALSSVLVARDGYGDMAVSNSIGSNIFDILLCLGLPWLIRTGMIQPGSIIQINSTGLTYTSITLLSTVVILVGAIMINKWRLNRLLGIIFLLIYVFVIAFSCLYELNVFGGFNLPTCPRTRI